MLRLISVSRHARDAVRLVITASVVTPMLQAIFITPEMRRVVREGRQASPPRTWREISEELGISLSSAVKVAKRVGLYQQIYRERTTVLLRFRPQRCSRSLMTT